VCIIFILLFWEKHGIIICKVNLIIIQIIGIALLQMQQMQLIATNATNAINAT
jgi:hypothetical protein